MMGNNYQTARIEKIRCWSPVWLIPILTVLIGTWSLFYHFSHQGKMITLTTSSADDINAGKTVIKSRSVDVGIVESIVLSNDFRHVEIKARIYNGMEKILNKDSAFWVVKPQIGKEGVSGLDTLLSGPYIQLQPGSSKETSREFKLLDAPRLDSPDAIGIRIQLDSDRSGQLSAGDPVLFRGFRVGTVESSHFDPLKRMINYQLFINAPYDSLVTTNIRFWKDSGVALNLSASGMRMEIGSLTTLFAGGVSFDVPTGWELGELAKAQQRYQLFDNKNDIADSLYIQHQNYVLFFDDSIRGLQPGAPVEFRGIRIGTVAEVPFVTVSANQEMNSDYRVPVLIHIEPDRFITKMGKNFDINKRLTAAEVQGFRAALKSANLLTGALYVDLDFYPQAKAWSGPLTVKGYPVLPTICAGLAQIQQKLTTTLDKINSLPLNPMLNQTTSALVQSRSTLQELERTLKTINKITESTSMQQLPQDMQKTLKELNRSMKGFQPGAPAYNKMVADMQRLDQVLRELQPVLRTLNSKSNSLVFKADQGQDPQPKRAQ
ncbi:MAG: intermembrane transport protein PqiB [Sodalis sp. (in: enterobacteria)]